MGQKFVVPKGIGFDKDGESVLSFNHRIFVNHLTIFTENCEQHIVI